MIAALVNDCIWPITMQGEYQSMSDIPTHTPFARSVGCGPSELKVVYYCPHPKDGEGNSFSLFVSWHPRGEGYPISIPYTSTGTMSFLGGGVPQWLVLGPFLAGGYPSVWYQFPSQGVPHSWMGYPLARGGIPPPGQVRMGVPPSQGWGNPSQVDRGYLGWGTPPARSGWGVPGMGYPPGQGWSNRPPPQDRTAYGVLNTWWAVCLLHSHKRTFLFHKYK